MSDTINAAPDGLEQLKAMLAGGLKAPIGQTLAFDLVEVERGRVVFEGRPDRSVYNPLGAVHGGYAATLLDSACGIATHSMLGPHRGHTTLELKVSYLRGLSEDSGTVRATGRVVSVAAVTLFLAGMGLVNPIGTAIALEPFADRAGAASALLGFLQMGCAAIGTSLVGILPLSPAGSFAWITAVSAALAAGSFARVTIAAAKAK